MYFQSYACYAKEEAIQMRGSSGGIYYLLAYEFISKGGIVYAACYDGVDVRHYRIDKLDDIRKSCGSKYVPSDIQDVYKSIKFDLTQEIAVMFVGTPCQCAAIKRFFRGQDNLFCVDFVCHGMPSAKVWHTYLKTVEKENLPLIEINMRDKVTGWENYSVTFSFLDGSKIVQPHLENPYIKGMLNDLYLRPSCYCCAFKGVDRETDITLGDMWGAEQICSDLMNNQGISLVMLHSLEGQRLFDSIYSKIKIQKVSIDECILQNRCITESVHRTSKRDAFFKRLDNGEPFADTVLQLTHRGLFERIWGKIGRLVQK